MELYPELSRKTLIVLVVLFSIVLLSGIFMYSDSGSVNCESFYNQTLEGEMQPDQIPDSCRPIPEDVEKRLLAQSLGG